MPDRLVNPAIYEIYPRSFHDSTGSGEGDLNGITGKLEHVRDLGVDAIWLAPFYPSPRVDGGYDVRDHRAVDPRLGSLEDFDRLLARAHELGLAVLIDMVFKHTSVDHTWFRAALDGDTEAAARYVFRDPKPDGTPPTNWIGYFGTPAWSWAHQRQQYYLHEYHRGQPSVNHRNPEVMAEQQAIMAFWKARGVDGFRFDAVTSWFHDEKLRDNPAAAPEDRPRIDGLPHSPYNRQRHRRDMQEGEGRDRMTLIREWAGDEMFLIGENNFGLASVEISQGYTGPGRLDACYTTDTVRCGTSPRLWSAMLDKTNGTWRLPWWFSSHDQARATTRLWDDHPGAPAFLAALLAVLPGSVMIYQGEELGLPQPDVRRAESEDPFDRAFWPDGPGRSGARVPIPWDETPETFGFTRGTPWLPMRWLEGISVRAQEGSETSTLARYRAALRIRRDHGLASPRELTHRQEGRRLQLTAHTEVSTIEAVFDFDDLTFEIRTGETVLMSDACRTPGARRAG
ncbi:alpha-glucosidase (plasmid) [Salipiger profundus]|uniref:Alpha-glucosidase n=1 Tax=Salipiger profundus TaxID=1229727 RepID=A0A1U7DCL8_9RHOB|nr:MULTISPECIES: alpha-amylase family glycosyl hydrolase [Salipiger]APX25868.1 alpha-glucosidase [Salipiger profundus]SFC81044.1 alpha-glucosidase [Salipiger profundus]